MVTSLYQLSHSSTGRYPTENQSCSKWSDWPPNRSLGSALVLGMKNGAFFCVISYYCAGNESDHGNPIESNKYTNNWKGLNRNRYNCNI